MSNFLTYWGITSQMLVEEAKQMGLQVTILQPNKNFFTISNGETTVYFKSNDFGGNSSLGAKIADDKELSEIFLYANGFPTTQSYYLNQEQKENFSLADTNLIYPLVTKPINESHGNGVTANITSPEMLQYGIHLAFSFSERIIIQKFIPGDEHRIVVIGDQVVLGYKRIPAHIVGDGIHTIEELIIQENKNPLRGDGYEKMLSYIPIDEKTLTYLQFHGLSLSSIPQNGETVQLTSVSNLGQGGTMQNVTDQICDELKAQCVAIAKKVGLVVAGIDVITTNLALPLDVSGGAVIEFNADPGFGGQKEPFSVNTAETLLRYVFS